MAPVSKKNTLSGADVLRWTTAQQSVSAPLISSAPLGAHLEISVERSKEPTATSTDQVTRTAFFSYVFFLLFAFSLINAGPQGSRWTPALKLPFLDESDIREKARRSK